MIRRISLHASFSNKEYRHVMRVSFRDWQDTDSSPVVSRFLKGARVNWGRLMKRDDEKEERKGERLSFSLSHHHPPAHPLCPLPPAHSFIKIINETMRDDCGRVRTGQDRIDRPLFKCCLALVNPEFGATTTRRLNQSRVSAVLQRNLIEIKFGAAEARRLNWALVFSDCSYHPC